MWVFICLLAVEKESSQLHDKKQGAQSPFCGMESQKYYLSDLTKVF